MTDLLELMFEGSVAGATGFVTVGRSVKRECRAGVADRDLPLVAASTTSLRLRPGVMLFADRILRHPSLSDRVATSFASLTLSPSSSSRISVGSSLSCFFFQLK
ncbi:MULTISPECIES: hypothetical protein [unclassified Bradyrhizobium]|uniref:hypothetical protein n=1 Tax=unclassified Bradyrhizobium TaxID=2631580 RepID=UPI001CD5A4F2|nr:MULTISPECIES: hypothetical protein [unclassified Bradyrhizobium]MCA1386144.1 hypothetical protein [Bradyrhizobium sp. BRP05]MCA1394225.1 hypothetical protein [Bradyrhizobium sp. IC3123]MCA1423684.1 hypothetical protein [Bradyrhizobium sp. BRP23]MCA1430696.1 hypothetical protein [Bradyrhizobium sp. NBAIM16]MCA1480281.1 hypothetical protein [Bradyrhizobium sp. NBAIM08]